MLLLHSQPASEMLHKAHLVLENGREQSQELAHCEGGAHAGLCEIIAARIGPAQEERGLCLVKNDLQVWVHLDQRVNGANMVKMTMSYCKHHRGHFGFVSHQKTCN